MTRKITPLLLAIVALFACTNQKKESAMVDDKNTVVIDAGIIDKEIIEDPDFVNVEIIKLECSKKRHLVGEIHKIIYKDGLFYLHDLYIAKAVYVFDRQGKFVNKIRRRGRGPGEYNECWDIDVDKEGNIYVFDVNQAKIVKYNGVGKLLSEYPYHFWSYNFSHVKADTFAMYQFNRRNDIEELAYNLLYWTGDQMVVNQYFPYANTIIEKGRALRSSYFQRTDHSVLFSTNLCDTIFEVLPEGIKPKYAIDFGDKKPGRDILDIEDSEKRVKQLYESNFAYNPHNYFEDGQQFVCSFLYRQKVGLMVYDKQTANTKYYLFSGILGRETKGFKPYGLCDGKIVGFFNPASLKKPYHDYYISQLQLKEGEYGELEENQIQNPYLVLYNIKNE